ncbi:hypothetical protein [Massilia alkalitolerans]|uniref:hypothetical protein n=1 Tax=Massilia alkalitolerans TaxID=286638 RepID=UPI0028B12D76|nr:hypothetical protein [Massilia alkalitolerans]
MTVFATDNTVAVFPFRLYDIVRDEFVTSRRLATMAAIQRLGATPAGPSYSIPQMDVDGDGLTAKDYSGHDAERKVQAERGY